MTSRIKGPGDKPPVDPTEAIDATDATGEIKPGEPARVSGPQASRATDAPDAIGKVAAQLKAGENTVDQAVGVPTAEPIDRPVGRAVDPARDDETELRDP